MRWWFLIILFFLRIRRKGISFSERSKGPRKFLLCNKIGFKWEYRVISQNVSIIHSTVPSLTELVLAVMGAYPEKKFHLFPLLLQDYRKLFIRLGIQGFPTNSCKRFMDTFFTESAKVDPKAPVKPIQFPPTIHSFYTQFLAINPPKEHDYLEVTPYEYYIIRFLTCIASLQVEPIAKTDSSLQLLHRNEKHTILAVQLFLHYLYYLINPQHPTKPSITNSQRPSLQRSDLFFLSAISELWLSRDDTIPDDLGFLIRECSHQSLPVFIYNILFHS